MIPSVFTEELWFALGESESVKEMTSHSHLSDKVTGIECSQHFLS